MRAILRKLRGALGTALTWAVGWTVAGFAYYTFLFVTGSFGELTFWEVAPLFALRGGLYGLVGGALFSGALATVHRRRTLGELKPAWVGLWGGLAGLLVGMGVFGVTVASAIPWSLPMLGVIALGASIYGGIGAVIAAGTIKIAQQGTEEIESSDPRPVIEGPRI